MVMTRDTVTTQKHRHDARHCSMMGAGSRRRPETDGTRNSHGQTGWGGKGSEQPPRSSRANTYIKVLCRTPKNSAICPQIVVRYFYALYVKEIILHLTKQVALESAIGSLAFCVYPKN